jgi:hypothetical protein
VARGTCVPQSESVTCDEQYNIRIFDVREHRFNIENRTEFILMCGISSRDLVARAEIHKRKKGPHE